MSLIGAGKSLGHWRPLLAAVAVFGMVLAFASAAAAQVGDSSNDQYKNRSSQYDQYSCSGCEPSSGCPDCGTGVGKDAKEIIGGPGDNAGKNDFSAALEAARSHRDASPALAAETGTGADPKPSGTPVAGSGSDTDIRKETSARKAANEDGGRSPVRDQQDRLGDDKGSGDNSMAGKLLGKGGVVALGASIVGTLLMAGFLVSRGSLRG